jgi:adenylate cyclase
VSGAPTEGDDAPVLPTEIPIDPQALIRRAGIDESGLARLVDLGIVQPRDDGAFRAQDLTTVRLAAALETSGVALDDVGAALTRGALPDLGSVLMTEPIGLLDRTYRQIADDLGIDVETLRRLTEAMGLPDIDLDDRVREDDAELLEVAATVAGRAGLPEDVMIRTIRVFAEHLDRIAEHQRGLFRGNVQDRMLAAGMTRAEVLTTTAPLRELLVRRSYRASHLIHRRMLERHAFENTAEQMEILLDEAGVRRRPDDAPPAMVFVDLSGYTRMTEEEGDERAAERGTELAQVVRSAAGRHGGRLIKLLGDGAMVHFRRVGDAVRAAVEIVERVEASELPAAHIGIASGPMIRRDGDYFGHTVNLAARICDAATAGSVLANSVVAELAPGYPWAELSEVELRGVPAPVRLVELTRSSSTDTPRS